MINQTSTYIILLGHENDEHGNLSNCALARCEQVIDLYINHPLDVKIITTGWYSKSKVKPHAYYLADYLIKKKVFAQDIYAFVYSRNSVEDALFTLSLIKDQKIEDSMFYIVTNFPHDKRVQLIFSSFFSDIKKIFKPARLYFENEISIDDEMIKYNFVFNKGMFIDVDQSHEQYELNPFK